MHIITKFLVILASVLAILLAGLTIAYSANADRLIDEVESARASLAAERTRANQAEAKSNANQDAQNQQLLSLLSLRDTNRDTIASLNADLADARAETRRLSQLEQEYRNQIDQFLALSEQDKTLRSQQADETRALRDEMNAQARRIIELVDRNSDLVSQVETLENQSRALAEQIEEMRRGEAGAGGALAALPESFRARVTSVIEDADGSTLVEINAGTSDRLAEEMELIAVRDGLFLAKIRLLRVDLNQAVGRIVLDGNNGPVRAQDEIRPAAAS